ncbi:MAG: gluconate 2-dehydrogenase subunit 3 family protein [Woeseiaceae bacterium]
MSNKNNVSRRDFLQATGSISGTAFLRLTTPVITAITAAACTAKQESAAFQVLGANEAADYMAIAARIIPTTDTPGATEAGVIHFFDNAFAEAMSAEHTQARSGLAEFNAALADATYAGRFDELGADDQDAFLRTQEQSRFFDLMWQMTMFGFFAMSSYGGNKDHVGWDLLEFGGHQGAWSYPFGYYDAEYAKQNTHEQ